MLIEYKFILWLFALIFLIWVVFSLRWFTFLDNHTPQQARDEHLDSLRFFLAFFVAIHHYAMSYVYFHGYGWTFETIENYEFVKEMGPFGVSVFFMISGYLFSDSKPNSWLQFFKKRYYRIAPLFFLSSIICILIALWLQRNILRDLDISMILANLYFWFDAGILGEKPPLFDLPDSYLINAGVTWTLFWEWAFYFSLPIVCLVRDKIGVIKLALAIIFISVYMIYPHQPAWAVYIALFAIGGLVKELPKKLQIPKNICDIGIVLTITFLFLCSDGFYNIYHLPLMAIMFALIAMGGDIFGLLRQKAFVRLGSASYSIYLLHGIAWFGMNKIIQVHHLTLSYTEYTLLTTIVLFILLMICTFTYYYIEKPCVELGRRKIKWIKADSQS